MKKNDYITILDPSLKNSRSELSDNLGDLIIYNSCSTVLKELFPDKEFVRITTHQYFTKKDKEIINNALYTFVGGTNILTSDIRHFPRLSPIKRKGFYLFPGFKNVILLGTGWAGYQRKMDWATRLYYKNILRRNICHSVRDNYSATRLQDAGFTNVIHTSCPTTWKLDTSFSNQFNPSFDKVLLMLTNYDSDATADNTLLEIILQTGASEIFFFPQSSQDTIYLQTLPAYTHNISKFKLLNHDLAELNNLVSSIRLNYIGNRLHGGIQCLAYKHPAMTISIDNRAAEMGKSINLNVTGRNNYSLLEKWIRNEYIPPLLTLPHQGIEQWQKQFKLN